MLEKIEQALLSNDPFVQRFSFLLLEDSFLATPNTLFTALKAEDLGIKGEWSNSILPHVHFLPVDEKGVVELLERLKRRDKNFDHYKRLLHNAKTEDLLLYKNEIKPYFASKSWDIFTNLKRWDTEELYENLGEIMALLDWKGFNEERWRSGQRIVQELINRNELDEFEVINELRNELEEDYFSYVGIYHLYMAGELKFEKVLPEIIEVLIRENESDEALEEASRALVKIGSDKVVKKVESIVLSEPNFIYTIDVLAKMKTKAAEEALLRLFHQTNDEEKKTFIADALCQHLSVQSIPLIEEMLESGNYDPTIELDESFYANVVINNFPLASLPELRKHLEEREAEFNSVIKEVKRKETITHEDKIGRNDPCPCGSGKKYKKCCLN